MEINVLALEKENDRLTKSIDSFYDNVLNIYNELNWASGCWNDFHAGLFFTNVNSEKIKINNTYNELKSLNDIYAHLNEGKDPELKRQKIVEYQELYALWQKIAVARQNNDLNISSYYDDLVYRLYLKGYQS